MYDSDEKMGKKKCQFDSSAPNLSSVGMDSGASKYPTEAASDIATSSFWPKHKDPTSPNDLKSGK
jgi:hypothetical protein